MWKTTEGDFTGCASNNLDECCGFSAVITVRKEKVVPIYLMLQRETGSTKALIVCRHLNLVFGRGPIPEIKQCELSNQKTFNG